MPQVRKYQNSFTSGLLSPGVAARSDLEKYSAGCEQLLNAIVYAHGGASNRPGTEYVDNIPGDGILIPFVYSVEESYVLCFFADDKKEYAQMRIYCAGAVVADPDTGDVIQIDTPYTAAEMTKIKFAQSADVMFLVHPAHPVQKLIRTQHHEWKFESLVFKPSLEAPSGLTATPDGFKDSSNTYKDKTIQYKVSAVSDREIESLPSDPADAKILSTWVSGATVSLEWQEVPGAVRYEVYKNARGYYTWIGSADSTSFTDDNIEGDDGTGPKEYRDPFDEENKYPGAIGIFQQRLVFGRSDSEPQTVWMTETGAFDSMAVAQPLRDDSAITVTVDSKQMNEIRHFIPLRDMLMLTSGAEFKVSAGSTSGAVTPTTVRFDIQSYWGSSDVPPLVSGTTVLLVENSGKVVRDLFYKLDEDGYSGNDISVLADHLFNSPVRDWAYQQDPFSTIYICLESGKLLTCTYMREQNIIAWAEHESSGGKFRSVSVIREKEEDNAYFIVKRDGRYFIEFQKRWHYNDDIADAFFVDCGLKHKGESIKTVTGLDHLEGKEISVLADGSVVRNCVVKNGSITLPHPASTVIAGLGYKTRITPVDPEIRADNGTTVGDKKVVTRATLFLRETRGVSVGPDEEHQITAKLPMPTMWGAPPPLFSGKVDVVLPGLHRDDATITICQDDPLPMTILGVVEHIGVK